MKKKIYISGPITGMPDLNRSAFCEASRKLYEAGYEPVVPLHYTTEDMSWEECMRRVIPKMLECDGVAQLKWWIYSKGAKLEMRLAISLGMDCKALETWL